MEIFSRTRLEQALNFARLNFTMDNRGTARSLLMNQQPYNPLLLPELFKLRFILLCFCVGELGKKFWGENHTVMDGDNLTLYCGSKVKGDPATASHYWFWILIDRHLGTKKLQRGNLLQREVNGRLTRLRPYGFRSAPERIPNTINMKLINVNRYATGTYVCAVATILAITPKRKNYVEGTSQNVVVKCKGLHNLVL
jgi:hypothetical protein